jgi:hypothetical protein
MIKFFIQLREFTIKNNFPMSLAIGDEEEYKLLRRGITGGLSVVYNRVNRKGMDTIKKLYNKRQ